MHITPPAMHPIRSPAPSRVGFLFDRESMENRSPKNTTLEASKRPSLSNRVLLPEFANLPPKKEYEVFFDEQRARLIKQKTQP